MKNLNQKINESINISLGQVSTINEAWGSIKHYKSDLENIFAKYEKTKNAKDKKYRVSIPGANDHQGKAWEVLSKYPMQILIDKAGYKPKEIEVYHGNRGRNSGYFSEFDKRDYGKFIEDQITNGKLTKEDMLKWWNEYEESVSTAKWHDIKFIVKQIDPTRCWNPYYPKDDSAITAIFNEPARLVSYLKPGNNLTWAERNELKEFLADPVNQESAKAALKGVKNAIMKARPTFTTGVENHIKSLIENCEYNDKKGALLQVLKDEYKSSHNRTRYQGSNDFEGCYGEAIVGLILKVINQLYGFEVWHSMYMDDNDDSYYADIEQKTRVRGEVSDETLDGFLNDADSMKFIVNDKGASEKNGETGTVVSSSFWSYYKHDFEVICKVHDEEVFHETFKNVTVGSSYYSGGWN